MSDPTEDAVRREIARARRILQADRHADGLKNLTERMDRHFPDNSGKKGDGPPDPPPAQPPADPEPKKGGIWWP